MGIELPQKQEANESPLEVPIGDPRGIDFTTGSSPAARKLSVLEQQDREIDTADLDQVEGMIDSLAKKLRDNPTNPDLQNQVARLQRRLEDAQRGTLH